MGPALLSVVLVDGATAELSPTVLDQSQNTLQLWREFASVTWSEHLRGALDAASVNLRIARAHTARDGRYSVSDSRVLLANSLATFNIAETSAVRQ